MNYDLEAARLKKDWAENPRWKGIKRGYTAEDVVRLRGSIHIEHTLARRGAEKLWKLINEEPFVNSLGAMTGNQAMQQVKAGPEGDLPVGLAGRRRRQHRRRDVPGPVAVPGELGAARRAPDQQHADARRPDPAHGRQERRHRLLRADRRRRRGRFRRRAERVRADEGDDRGRRRRRPLRGPARVGQEVRPHGRQGAGADARGGREAGRGAARRRLHGRADDPARAHRRRGGRPAHLRRRRQRQAVPHRRAHRRGLLQDAQRPRAGDLARARLRAVRGPDLVRDRQARPRVRQAVRRGDPGQVPGQDAGLQLLAVVQLEEEPRRRDDRASSSASWARWATSSSSSRWPASTASTTRCSTSRTATRATR